jgi:hypothetical protein
VKNAINIVVLLASLTALTVGAQEANDEERLIAALAILCGDPSLIEAPEHAEASETVAALWKPHLHKLDLPDKATEWVPSFGPCGGPGSPLLSAFVASVLKDKLLGKSEGSIYRGWLVAIRHYQYYRKTAPSDFPPVASLEQMIKDEAEHRLHEKAAAVERLLPKRQGPS